MTLDVSEQTFQAEVLDASHSAPVVVDFWAEWCGPCRALGPALEEAAAAHAGAVTLVKVNVDQSPTLARSFGVRGVPAVKAFRDGRVVSEFTGAKPASEVKRFFESLLPSEADGLVERGDEASLLRALEIEPARADAKAKLARILNGRGEWRDALELLDQVPGDFAAAGLAARIRLERGTGPDLAEAFSALDGAEYERALEMLLDVLPNESGDVRDLVRKVFVGILDELGPEHALTGPFRRRLATSLY